MNFGITIKRITNNFVATKRIANWETVLCRRHKSHLQDGAYATTMLMSTGASGGPLDGKHFDRQYADCDDPLASKGRMGVGGGCVGGNGSAGEYASNSLRTDLSCLPENSDRTNFYRQERCSISGTSSPFSSSVHHHHHHLTHHPYESPVILT